MSTDLYIKLPSDFKERYEAYKTKLLGPYTSPSQSPMVAIPSGDVPSDKKVPSTKIESDIGYLLFHGEEIKIGGLSTGKFKLVEILCVSFGQAKSVDIVFTSIKGNKDKNKADSFEESDYTGYARKKTLLKGQMREINRAIVNHIRSNNLKGFKHRLTLEFDRKTNNKVVWLEEKSVGWRGK